MGVYNYDDMFDYVLNVLTENNGIKSKQAKFTFRNRFKHIKRVFGWAKRIMECLDVNEEVVLTAVIFHDCGYSLNLPKEGHALRGANIFKEYALKNCFSEEFIIVGFNHNREAFINTVYDMILNHSNKELLNKEDTSLEMIVLLEADLMDEEGALGLVLICLLKGQNRLILMRLFSMRF